MKDLNAGTANSSERSAHTALGSFEMPPYTTKCAQAGIPTLPSTQLCLALALFQHAPDLSQLSAVLLEDPAAVLHIFALTSHISAPCAGPLRVKDRIASLGRDTLTQAFLLRAPAKGPEGEIAIAFAQGARATAQMCQALAETLGLPEEEAYLVGLLQGIGSLLQQPHRSAPGATTSAQKSACRIVCQLYELPFWLQQALLEVERGDVLSPWTAMVHAAYDLMSSSAQGASAATTRTLVHPLSEY